MAGKIPPPKPSPGFPLSAHRNGQWCKKIARNIRYFGPWEKPDEAYALYVKEKSDWEAGRKPRRDKNILSTKDVVNLFLLSREIRMKAGTLAGVTYEDYVGASTVILDNLGRTTSPSHLSPADFSAMRTAIAHYSPSRVTKFVALTKMIFKWASESDLIVSAPKYGPDFKSASTKSRRFHKAASAPKLFSRDQIRTILGVTDKQWTAIVLLCINGGLGNSDIARVRHCDIKGKWLSLPRGKTGIQRRIPLWPETLAAINALDRSEAQLLFQSKVKGPLMHQLASGAVTDLTIENFRKWLKTAGIYQTGMGLYWLRHTFQTIGDDAKDPVATSAIMGHADNTMAGVYRESISDKRLLEVTNHVRRWLFAV